MQKETVNEAIILIGGKGTRLQSVVNDRPKPMAEVVGRPFVEWLLLALSAQGVKRVVLCTGYMGDVIEAHLGGGTRLGIDIVCIRDPLPLGTGGAIRHALDQVQSECFLALNGDSYCRFDAKLLQNFHRAHHAQATIWLVPSADSQRYGSVEVDQQGAVLAFHEKSTKLHKGIINAGVYMLERAAVLAIPQGRAISLETEFFPSLIGMGLYGVVGKGPFIDIGTPESYHAARHILQEEFRGLI